MPASKGAFALTEGFREARSRSTTQNVETRRDGTQKRQELANMKPGDLRRSLERRRARAEEVQHLQDKKEQAWEFFRRPGGLGRRTNEEFEKEFDHRVMRNEKADQKLLQEWTD